MARDLSFDVTARDSASSEFLAIAAQLKELSKQLSAIDGKKAKATVALAGAEKAQAQAQGIRADVDKLDGRNARVKVSLDAASSAPIERFAQQLRDLDGKTARADVQLTGVDAAKAKVLSVAAALKALPNRVAVALNVDMDKGVGDRISAVAAGVSRLGSVASSAASGAQRFRSAAAVLVDPGSLPVIQRVSDAISTKFHSAVDVARVGVEKLHTVLGGLEKGLVGVGAAGNTLQLVGSTITSVVGAVTQLSGAALILPGALLVGASAVATLKIGFSGLGDAIKAADPKAFAAATKDMAPAAIAAANAVRGLKTEFVGVKQAVQGALFKDVAADVSNLGKSLLPTLKSGLSGIAAQLNTVGRESIKAAQSPFFKDDLTRIFGNTASMFREVGSGVGDLMRGIVGLGGVGSNYLPALGTAIGNVADKFKQWVDTGVENGKIQGFIDNAIRGFKDLGAVLKNVGSILVTVFSALNGQGGGTLATLRVLTTDLRAFLESAQGTAALQSLGQTLQVVGDALSRVFGAALRAIAPILVAAGPALQLFAAAIGDHLVTVIRIATPILTALASALSAHPALLRQIATAATVLTLAFTPMVAIIGVAATVLKGLILARVAGLAMAALGLEGTRLAQVIGYIVRPMTLLRDLFPLIARGAGSLLASLGLFAGPVGALVVLFATLYATSSQFRDGMNDIAGTLGRIFVKALQDAGSAIQGTLTMLRDFGSAINAATGGLQSVGASIMSVFGPIGRLVSGALSGLFDILGKLPGTALAAFAAFKAFGLLAPIFTGASAAIAGMSARLLAFQGASGAATVGANAAGLMVGKFGTALSKVGSALPLVGVAVIALGAIYGQFSSIASDVATNVVNGTQSMSGAIAAEYKRIQSNVLFGVDAQRMMSDATNNVRGAVESQLQAMGPLDQAQARVKISQQNLNDAVLQYGPRSAEAGRAAQVLARDQADLASKQDSLKTSTQAATDAMKAQADQMSGQVNASLAYKQAVQATADAQKAATQAILDHGLKSDEAQKSILQLAQSEAAQADAARKAAEATGGAGAGIAAYNLELQGMNRSSQAGSAAFAMLADGLDQAGLDALSAQAAMSGLRTEVVTLPSGRTVTVVAAVDQGKLDELKTKLDAFRAAPVSITIDANVNPATGAIEATATLANGTTGTIQLTGNPSQANGVITQTVAMANGQVGTMTYKADALQADGTVRATVTYADGTSADMTFKAADGPARATIAGTVAWARSQTPTMTAQAMTGAAEANLAYLARTRTAYINVITTGATSAGNLRINNPTSGGGVFGYAGGGVAGPVRAARGYVVPGYAPGRDTVPAVLSKGEAVLVPELVRALGANRILAANREASGGRPASITGNLAGLMDGTVGRGSDVSGRISSALGPARGGGAGAAQGAAWAGITAVASGVAQLRGDIQMLATEIRKQRPFVVEDRSGNPVETARATALALRIS